MATWYPFGYGPHPNEERKSGSSDELERNRQLLRKMQLEREAERRDRLMRGDLRRDTRGTNKQ